MNPQGIIRENDSNMKTLKAKLDGKIQLQRNVLTYINKYEAEEKERWDRALQNGGGYESKGEQLVKARKEAQKKKRKAPPESGMCTLDPDGAHQPVRIQMWNDEPAPP